MGATYTGTEIAIVGVAGHYPKSAGARDFWARVRDGAELVTFFEAEQLLAAGVPPEVVADPKYVKAAAFLEEMELFDAGFFGVPAAEAALMDPQHRHFLECAWEVLEDAGYDPQAYPGRVGVYASAAMDTYLLYNVLRSAQGAAADPLQVQIANDKDYLPTRVSYKLNLRGPSLLVQSACSSSLVAAHVACQALLNGECDLAIVGGAAVLTHVRHGYRHKEGGVASPDGRCRSFDADANGTVFGSGVGAVALKPLDRALADGDHIYAVVLGTAVNNDGNLKAGFAAPSVDGVAEVVEEALANAGVGPETIGYVEAHGTATPLGDAVEVQGLSRAYRAHTTKRQYCPIGSVKSNVGHLDAASGVTALIKVAMALREGAIPPSLHYRRPNPAVDFAASPFFVNDAPRPWRAPEGVPRRAGVSSLGIGGTNAHAILEEAPATPAHAPAEPEQLLLLSAKTPAALDRATERLALRLREAPDVDLADAAYTLQVGRQHFDHRRFVVARDRDGAVAALTDPARPATARRPAERPSVVFMFSGQGSQYSGMAAGVYRREPAFREPFDRCAEAVRAHTGADLRALVIGAASAEADERLRRTELAQPALFAVEYAMARLLERWGVRPDATIGHSVGEYAAACLAGVFTPEDAASLVCERGRLMAAMPPGAMLSVPLPEGEVWPLLDDALALAAVNAPDRCVVSGPTAAVEALERRLGGRGVPCRRLVTSHAFHSAMMDPILPEFRARVAATPRQAPRSPFVSNVTGRPVRAEEATDPEYWARHLRGTVRFDQGIAGVLQQPGRVLVEVGPGNALATFARQRPADRAPPTVHTTLPHAHARADDVRGLLSALGRLWLDGVAIDWPGMHEGARRRRVPLPAYPFERERHWLEPARGQALPEAPREAAAPAPEAGRRPRPELASAYVAPRNENERRVAESWQAFLGVDRVGVNDNFFDLGGDSIVATRLILHLEHEFDRSVQLVTLFEGPTVARLAQILTQGREHAAPPDGAADEGPELEEGEL